MSKSYIPAAGFDILTPKYDFLVSLLGYGKQFHQKILQHLELKSGDKILDVGCGTGSLLLAIKQKMTAVEAVGVDPDERVLSQARQKFNQAKLPADLIQAFGNKTPFADGEFDWAVSSLTFHHMSTEAKLGTAREVFRVLKKGGKFLLVDFGRPETLFEKILITLGGLVEGRAEMEANIRGLLPQMLKEAGFAVSKLPEKHRGVRFWVGLKVRCRLA